MRVRRFLLGLFFLAIIVACGIGFWWQYKDLKRLWGNLDTQDSSRPMWASDRPVPATVRPGAYLAALNAVFNEDLEKAAAYYLEVLSGDPNNEKLQREAYFFNAILGNFEILKPLVMALPSEYRVVFLTDYVKLSYLMHDEKWQQVRADLQKKPSIPMADIVTPLISAWSYAAEKDYKSAMAALDLLKQNGGVTAYYHYHRGLIALSLGQDFAADEAFQKLAENKLPTFSLYPEIKSFYVRRGEWRAENPFFVQWQAFAAEQPATAELIMSAGSKQITAKRGVAEVFYNLSTAMGGTKGGYEGGLILSALSLYLNPNQELPKIWNAEVLEQAKKPHLASHYYDQLRGKSTQTMAFKKAMNLLACGREEEAKPLLLQLEHTNQNSTPLWWALASVYQNEKNWPSALHAYTRILEIEGESNKKYASDVYFARAFIYGEQKKFNLAESDLQHALELNPDNPMLLNHLGYQLLDRDHMLDRGFELVQKAYQLKANDPHIIDSMAYAYYRKAEYQKALPLAEKTVDIMPQSSVANAHLGDIYQALGRHREAVFQYKKALALKYDLTSELKQELLHKIAQKQ